MKSIDEPLEALTRDVTIIVRAQLLISARRGGTVTPVVCLFVCLFVCFVYCLFVFCLLVVVVGAYCSFLLLAAGIWYITGSRGTEGGIIEGAANEGQSEQQLAQHRLVCVLVNFHVRCLSAFYCCC